MKKILLHMPTKYQIKQCELFAHYSVSTNTEYYKKRMQFDEAKVRKDIFIGKIAEFMVFNYLKSKGKNLSPPDLQIYPPEEKSFDCDLQVDENRLHVKSHLVNDNYPVSWVFHSKDALVTAPHEKDYLCLVVISKESYMYLVPAKDAKYKEPIKAELKSKCCIYENDLI